MSALERFQEYDATLAGLTQAEQRRPTRGEFLTWCDLQGDMVRERYATQTMSPDQDQILWEMCICMPFFTSCMISSHLTSAGLNSVTTFWSLFSRSMLFLTSAPKACPTKYAKNSTSFSGSCCEGGVNGEVISVPHGLVGTPMMDAAVPACHPNGAGAVSAGAKA